MGGIMTEVLDNLTACISNPEEFLRGNAVLCHRKEWIVKKDQVHGYLSEPNSDIDDDCYAMLKVVLPSIAKLLKIHYGDLMLMNTEANEVEKEETSSVVKHNKFAERVFAYTDYLLKTKPAICHISQEAYIMFCLNKTTEWLRNKDDDERKKEIHIAMNKAPYLQKKYQERKEKIKETRRANLTHKLKEEAARKAKRAAKKELIVREKCRPTMFYSFIAL